jgi:hypothetical protein
MYVCIHDTYILKWQKVDSKNVSEAMSFTVVVYKNV